MASVNEAKEESWETLCKIVPVFLPRDNYPDYAVGYTYEHEGDTKMCKSGFHASPTFFHCVDFYEPTERCIDICWYRRKIQCGTKTIRSV